MGERGIYHSRSPHPLRAPVPIIYLTLQALASDTVTHCAAMIGLPASHPPLRYRLAR